MAHEDPWSHGERCSNQRPNLKNYHGLSNGPGRGCSEGQARSSGRGGWKSCKCRGG